MKSVVLRSLVAVLGLTAFLGVVNVGSDSSGSSTSVGLVTSAHADNYADYNHDVLACFHSMSDFVGGSIGPEFVDANGRTTRNGRINFRGGFTNNSYQMTFVIHYKLQDGDLMRRVTPITDNAPFAPDATCWMRDWNRVE
jgi:hypothetical protein